MLNELSFEQYLERRGDAIDNAAYSLALTLLRADDETSNEDVEKRLPWNMEILGEIIENAESTLERHGYFACYPYYDDGIACPKAGACLKKDCPFKNNSKEDCK